MTNTWPKIIETFGGSEVFGRKMTTSWVGTDPKNDIPLPENVRRYNLPSSTHGGGGGGFSENPSTNPVNCPGNNWGRGTLRANPVPSTELVSRLRVALRDWLLHDIAPPPSRWPLLRGPENERKLVEPTMAAMGFHPVREDQDRPRGIGRFRVRRSRSVTSRSDSTAARSSMPSTRW